MNILFLQKRILFPPDSGGKIRTLNVLKYLARWHQVTYLCNRQEADEAYLEKMREIGVRLETVPWRETSRESWKFYAELAANIVSPYPYTVSKDYDVRLRRRAKELLASAPYDLVICDFVQMARNATTLDFRPKILFQHNVEAQIFHRHVQNSASQLRRWYMNLQWRKMRRYEASAGQQFDAVVAVSEQDKRHFEQEYGWNHVRTIDTGVDVDYFRANGSVEHSDTVVFIGSMDWLANQDAVDHFVSNHWPGIRRQCPEARFQIVGRNPSPAVTQLAQIEGVEVVGTVPDIRPYVEAAALVVVPLRIGGGTRIKIFEAMAMQKAVVSTFIGAEGLPVVPDRHLVLADDDSHFVSAVVELLGDPARRAAIGQQARDLVCGSYSAETVARQFEKICLDTVEAAK